MNEHSSYHCLPCGKQLVEVAPGVLYCKDCKIHFLLAYNPKDRMFSVSWTDDIEIETEVTAEVFNYSKV